MGGRTTLNSILASLRLDPVADMLKVWQAPSTIHSFLGKLDYLQKNLGGSTHNHLVCHSQTPHPLRLYAILLSPGLASPKGGVPALKEPLSSQPAALLSRQKRLRGLGKPFSNRPQICSLHGKV